jgi:hypothetical protein
MSFVSCIFRRARAARWTYVIESLHRRFVCWQSSAIGRPEGIALTKTFARRSHNNWVKGVSRGALLKDAAREQR